MIHIILTPLARTWVFRLAVLALLLHGECSDAHAQTTRLPTPDKIVGDYSEAVGGRKKLASVSDAAFEWVVAAGGEEAGRARSVAGG